MRMQNSRKEQSELLKHGNKRCSACKEVFPLEDFSKNHNTKDGCASVCKKCKNKRDVERRKRPEVKDKYKKTLTEWRKSNRQHLRDYHREYRDKTQGHKDRKSHFSQGYIYVFKWENFVKIGISINPSKRIQGLSTGLPTEGKLIHLIKTNNMRDAEKTIHDKFSYARKRGEWFSLTESDLEYLQSLTYIDTNLITP